ncbi:MAG: flagellin [Alphaproteobacteria bacterium]
MTLNVISNFAANVAHRNLVNTDAAATASLTKLSAGTRVVSAKDDAASLAIGSRLNAEVQALRQANVNAVQATSMLQIADGAMSKVSEILVRMKTLAQQAGSGQLSNTERGMLNTEYQSLLSEVDRIANATVFNGVKMVAGNATTQTSLNGQTGTANFIQAGDGFQSIAFDATVTDTTNTTAVFTFSYDSTTNVLTAKNLTNGTSEGIDVGSSPIAVNATQTITFGNLGVVVTLNAGFDKTTNIVPASATAFSSDSAGQIEDTSIKLSTIDAVAAAAITTNTVSVDASTGGVAASVLTLGSYTGTADLTSTGVKTVTMTDGSNSLDVSFNVTTAFTTNDDAASFTVGDLGTVVVGTNTTSNTSFSFKLGSGNVPNVDSITVTVNSITAQALGLNTTSVDTAPNAESASVAITAAIDTLNIARANVGAAQNRMEFAAGNLAITVENMEAARSNLLDLDIAQEMTTLTSKQILMQTGVAMLAQANQLPQSLLRLFQ